MPANVTATTSAVEAIAGARYAIHAVPVQHSREFLNNIKVMTNGPVYHGWLVLLEWCLIFVSQVRGRPAPSTAMLCQMMQSMPAMMSTVVA